MKNFLLVISIYLVSVSLAFGATSSSEQRKIDEIFNGQRSNCENFEHKLSPTLNFETLSPSVFSNENSSQISLQIKLIYYRCLKKINAENAEFVIVDDLSQNYQYNVTQLDGTINLVKVKNHKHRFKAKIGNLKGNQQSEITSKMEKEGKVYLSKINIPLSQLLSEGEKIRMRNGSKINVSIPIVSELSTEYSVDSHINDSTGFEPGSIMTWDLELTLLKKEKISVRLLKVR